MSFDINYRSALADPAAAGPVLRDIAERADIIFGDAAELAVLYRTPPPPMLPHG